MARVWARETPSTPPTCPSLAFPLHYRGGIETMGGGGIETSRCTELWARLPASSLSLKGRKRPCQVLAMSNPGAPEFHRWLNGW